MCMGVMTTRGLLAVAASRGTIQLGQSVAGVAQIRPSSFVSREAADGPTACVE